MYQATLSWLEEPSAESYRIFADGQVQASLAAGTLMYVAEVETQDVVWEIQAVNRWGEGPKVAAQSA